jgi:hypothetical protein
MADIAPANFTPYVRENEMAALEKLLASARVAAVATILIGISASATAMDVVTQCPAVSPNDGSTPISGQFILHFGDMEMGGQIPAIDIADGKHGYEVEELEWYDLRSANIECRYGPRGSVGRHTVFVRIPGRVLRCEHLSKSRTSDGENWETLRFWCTSRIEAPAR